MKKNEVSISEAIKMFMKEYGMEERVLQSVAIDTWDKQMGAYLSKYTEKIYVKNRIMYVKLNSPALKKELSFGKNKIVTHINEDMGEEFIQDLKFI